jgi:acyl-coenzyme A synthetase/AMP-(fatty) acid ligase
VSPTELEEVLLSYPDVIDGAVVAVKDENDGDLPRALVVVKQPKVFNTEDIANFVNGWYSSL